MVIGSYKISREFRFDKSLINSNEKIVFLCFLPDKEGRTDRRIRVALLVYLIYYSYLWSDKKNKTFPEFIFKVGQKIRKIIWLVMDFKFGKKFSLEEGQTLL